MSQNDDRHFYVEETRADLRRSPQGRPFVVLQLRCAPAGPDSPRTAQNILHVSMDPAVAEQLLAQLTGALKPPPAPSRGLN